jgi:hypothetical protein
MSQKNSEGKEGRRERSMSLFRMKTCPNNGGKLTDFLGFELNRMALRRVFESHINGGCNYAPGLWPLLTVV